MIKRLERRLAAACQLHCTSASCQMDWPMASPDAAQRQYGGPLNSRHYLYIVIFCLMLGVSFCSVEAEDIDLHGTIDHRQADGYVLVPFQVPPGMQRLEISFSYTGKEDHTTLDLGLLDPDRFRGWSGGNKHAFNIGISDATPSYLPGPLPAGTWKLLIGVAYLGEGHTSTYDAHIHLVKVNEADTSGFASDPVATGDRWYRGDLHMHTAHSDGSCTSQSGKMVPCPVFVTVEDAVKKKLDFIAITDHNTISHYDAERELQPYFDHILLIPGREITTYSGHANVLGPTSFIDFRSEAKDVPSINSVFQAAGGAGAFVSINHPGDPTGASCIGCGWSISDTDWSLVNGIEAINGDDPHHYEADIHFWDQQLAKGYRLVAVGGSDTHRPEQGTLGHPTTVVHAQELSVHGILDALRAGHDCIDLTASHDKRIDLHAADSVAHAEMGEMLSTAGKDPVTVTAHIVGAAGSTLHWLLDGKELPSLSPRSVTGDGADVIAQWTSDGQRHWLRAEVRTTDGRLQLLSNPVFLNWTVDTLRREPSRSTRGK
jgi:predicted metal-dependent phosphoesterase TrpH